MTAKWTEVNSHDGDVKYCDQWICDFEAVGYVIALDGVRYCLCATCREAFQLGVKACRAGGDLEFYDFGELDDWSEDGEHSDV